MGINLRSGHMFTHPLLSVDTQQVPTAWGTMWLLFSVSSLQVTKCLTILIRKCFPTTVLLCAFTGDMLTFKHSAAFFLWFIETVGSLVYRYPCKYLENK